MKRRRDITQRLGDFAEAALKDLTGGLEKFEVRYEPQLMPGREMGGNFTDQILEPLKKARREEIASGDYGDRPASG